MIEIRINELLKNRGRSFYWLAKETGISHTTLWRLKKGKALGINFETLEKMCETLKCQPGDALSYTNRKNVVPGKLQKESRRSSKSLPGAVTRSLRIETAEHARHRR
jgi:putative transcriptional regulator